MTTSLMLRIAFLLSLAVSSLCAAQTYAVTDLGTLPGGGYSVARGINATGQITGAAGSNNSPNSSVFVYSNGALTNLGTLGGTSGISNGINASGQVAGYSQNGSAPIARSCRMATRSPTLATWGAVQRSDMPSTISVRLSVPLTRLTGAFIPFSTATVT